MPVDVPQSPRPEVFLLLKAIQALPADERDQVLAWLLYRPDSILPRHPTGRSEWLSASYGALASTVFEPATMHKARASASAPSGMQLVPVPLPAEAYDSHRPPAASANP